MEIIIGKRPYNNRPEKARRKTARPHKQRVGITRSDSKIPPANRVLRTVGKSQEGRE